MDVPRFIAATRGTLTKSTLVPLAMLVVTACAAPPPIATPDGTPHAIPGLQDLVNRKSKLVIVFIHGVGDHCPHYALDQRYGWIGDESSTSDAFRQVGLTSRLDPNDKRTYDQLTTPLYVSGEGARHIAFGSEHTDWIQFGNITTTRTRLRQSSNEARPTIDAVEITWSELTHQIKGHNLDYDTTEAGLTREQKALAKADMGCFENKDTDEPPAPSEVRRFPPARAYANSVVKEGVLDRELSDAMLYAGPYGRILQRAIAQGLCAAITIAALPPGDESLQPPASGMVKSPCTWDRVKPWVEKRDTAYVFVTHSLGSRMLYNVLLNLNKVNWYNDTPFEEGTDDAAFAVVPHFTCQIPVIYMMANQLSLLGLASIGTTEDIVEQNPTVRSARRSAAMLGPPHAGDRPQLDPCVAGDAVGENQKPRIIAFVDSNDLLSWSIKPTTDPRSFDFVNVFVNNSRWHWFGLYENALTAHTGYFDNEDVGKVIACGVDNQGRIRQSCTERLW